MARATGYELVVGHEAAMHRLSASMLRNSLVLAAVTAAGCLAVFSVLAGAPGFRGAAIGAVVVVVFAVLTPVLVRKTADLDPRFVMLASVFGLLTKSLVLFVVLITTPGEPWIDQSSLTVTILLGLILGAAGTSWASYRLRVLVGELPESSRS